MNIPYDEMPRKIEELLGDIEKLEEEKSTLIEMNKDLLFRINKVLYIYENEDIVYSFKNVRRVKEILKGEYDEED